MQPKYYGAAAEYNNRPTGGFQLNRRVLMLVGLIFGVLTIVIVALTVVSTLSRGPSDDFARLVMRESRLAQLLDKQKGNIKNSDLRTINATAILLTAGDSSKISKQLTTVFGLEGVPETISLAETDTATDTTLKTAMQAGAFDRTYVSTVRDKLAANYSLAEKLRSSVNSEALKTSLAEIMTNLTAIDEQLAKLQL